MADFTAYSERLPFDNRDAWAALDVFTASMELFAGGSLTNVRRIVHRHGEKVFAESRRGEGATFCFTLPSE